MFLKLICMLLVLWKAVAENIEKPNIVFIIADDLGWDDVSFHGSNQVLTPNIDVLAYDGQILSQYYTDSRGTPARSALLTGKYPHKIGTHGSSIRGAEDRGIPPSERLLPSYLRDLGYATHLVGKWHVGKSRRHYLPTERGFDTFYGFLGGAVDYYTFNLVENYNESAFFGLDFWDGEAPLDNQAGYLTDLITSQAVQRIRDHNTSRPLYLQVAHAAPRAGGGLVRLQPPPAAIDANAHIAHSARRLYAGLVTSVDKCVGQIVSALAERDILRNTLIIFVSDNGAPTIGEDQNFGCNLPLRGVKNSPWEGAARSVGVMWHNAMRSGTYQGLFHVTDWLPTLVAAAGGKLNENLGFDGINQWDSIVGDVAPKRKDALITIDDQNGWAAFREGDFKLIVGDLERNSSQYFGMELMDLRREGPLYETMLLDSDTLRVMKETLDIDLNLDLAFETRNLSNLLLQMTPAADEELCVPTKNKGCLFNITGDPLEGRDLWSSSPEVVRRMTLRLRTMWTEVRPRRRFAPDARAKPSLRNYTWAPWLQNEEMVQEPPKTIAPFPLHVSMDELQYLVDLNLNSFKENVFQSISNMGKSFVKSVSGLFNFNN